MAVSPEDLKAYLEIRDRWLHNAADASRRIMWGFGTPAGIDFDTWQFLMEDEMRQRQAASAALQRLPRMSPSLHFPTTGATGQMRFNPNVRLDTSNITMTPTASAAMAIRNILSRIPLGLR